MGHLGAKLGDLRATFGALGFLMIFFIDFGSKKVPQREAFWDPKLNENQSKIEVQIYKQKNHLLESSWCDFGSMFKASRGQKC